MNADAGTLLLFVCGMSVFVLLLMAWVLVRMAGLVSRREEEVMTDKLTLESLRQEALGWRAAAEKYRQALEMIKAACEAPGASYYAGRTAAMDIANNALGCKPLGCKADEEKTV